MTSERLAGPPARRVLLGLAATKLLLHGALANRYGYFRDELYFLDCGRHLDWGYVDHAPLIGVVARLALLLGGSLPVLRLMAAGAGAGLVYLAGLIAWRLGGGRFAQGFSALAVLLAPIYLASDSLLTMNAFEPLFWMGSVYWLLRAREAEDSGEDATGPWLAVGALLGLGVMNKHSTAFFGVAIAAGLCLTPARRALRTRGPWLAVALVLLIAAPNLAWQARHAFPTLEDLRNVARSGKNVALGPLPFFAQQVQILHPVLAPLWLGGAAALLFARRGRHRSLGLAFVAFFLLMFALRAKSYYLAPVYPLLFAAGAVALERALDASPWTRSRTWPRAAITVPVALAGALTAPLVLPLLSPEGYVAFEHWLGVAPPKTEVAHVGPLPQPFGDQFGWPELVEDVARIYDALPPEERAHATIFANNYGEAGAINLFGPRHGLPRAISAHQTYFLWGPGEARSDVIIVLQGDREDLERGCASVVEAGTHRHPWGMEEENQPIFVCRGLSKPLQELWPSLKHWN